MGETRRETVAVLVGLVVLLLLPAFVSALGQPYLVKLACRILIYALAAASLDLILGFGGMVSFGHAAFFGLGGYVVGILAFQLSQNVPLLGLIPGSDRFLVSLPAAAVVAGLAALVIGAMSLRTRGVSFIMITLAFAQMVYFLFVSLKTYGGDDGLVIPSRDVLPGLDLHNDTVFYFVSLAALVVFLGLCDRLIHSRFGMVIRGIKENERRMTALGFSTYGYKLVAFAIAGAGAGVAGALLANLDTFISPDTMHWTTSGDLLIMVIIGGMGTLYGAVVGAAVLLGLENVLSLATDHWMIVLGPVLVLVALFADRGLYGLIVRRGDLMPMP